MKTIKGLVLAFTALAFILSSGSLYAEEKKTADKGDDYFELLDKDKDGRISKEEWDAMDANKDGKITPKEWKRFNLKGSRTVKWIDANSDGYMDKREFQDSFRK